MKKRVYVYVWILSMALLFGCAPSEKGSSPSSKGEPFESYVNEQFTPTKIVIRYTDDNWKEYTVEYTSEEDIHAILNQLKQASFEKKTMPLGSACNDYRLEIYDQEEMAVSIAPLRNEESVEYCWCVFYIASPFQSEQYKEEKQSLKEGEEILYKIDKNLNSYIRELFQAKNGK